MDSKAYIRHQGDSLGLEMYRKLAERKLAESKITLNCHEEIAGNYASNMRLYKATGMGACLITDWKENLPNIFEPDLEIVIYRSLDKLVSSVM